MKRLLPLIIGVLAVLLGSFYLANAAGPAFQYASGGTGSSTIPAIGQLFYAGATAWQSVATTSVTCSGTASCTSFKVIGSSPIIITGSGGGSTFGQTFEFPTGVTNAIAPTTTVGIIVNAASSTIFGLNMTNSITNNATTTTAYISNILGIGGNVTNGTNNTPDRLYVKGTGFSSDPFVVQASNSANSFFKLFNNGSGNIDAYFGVGGVTKILLASGGNSYFNTGGNVGIGTTNPGSLLTVAGISSTTGLIVSGAGGSGCATFASDGTISSTGTACGSGGGSGLSTTSPISAGNLLEYSATGAGSAFGVATGTVSAGSSAITVTAGRSAIGGALAIDCAAASGSQNGCLSSTDWSTFNSKIGGSGTISQVAYFTAAGTVASEATGTITCAGTDTCTTTGLSVLGGNLTITGAGGGGSGTVGTSTNETSGFLSYWTSNSGTPALLGQVATSSPTFNGGLTTSGTAGAIVGGSGFTVSLANVNANSVLGCSGGAACTPTSVATSSLFQTASATASGLLSSTDWSTFNNKLSTAVTSIATNNGITGGTITTTGTIGLAAQNANTVLANVTGASGVPTGLATSSLFAAGTAGNALTYTSAGTWLPSATTTFATTSSAGGWGFSLAGNVQTLNIPRQDGTQVLGLLNSTDWTTFNNKGSGTVTAVSVASANGFAGSSSGGATPALTLTTSITGILKGNGTAISAAAYTDFPTISSNSVLANVTGGALAPASLSTSSLFAAGTAGQVLTYTSAGTYIPTATTTFSSPLSYSGSTGAVSCASCLTANQSITLSGVVTGSGATAITTAFGSQSAGVLGSAATGNTAPMATSTLYGAVQNGKILAGLNGALSYVATSTDSCGSGITCSYSTGTNSFSIGTNALALSQLPQISGNRLWGNVSGTTANAGEVSTSSLFAAGTAGNILTYTSAGTWVPTATTTFSTGLTYSSTGAVTVNTSQNITTLSNLSTNALVVTSGGNGTLGAYGGASACSSNNWVTTISAIGGTTCGTIGANGLTLSMFPTIGANTVIGNLTGATATPTAFATSSLFSGTAGQNAFFSGTGTLIGTSSIFTNTTTGNVGISTTTPVWPLSIFANVAPQLALSAGNTFSQWFMANEGGSFYLGTTTVGGTATSSFAAFSIDASQSTSTLSVGTTTSNGILNLGSTLANGTTTIQMAKIQFDGMNAAGARICTYVNSGNTWTIQTGACTY